MGRPTTVAGRALASAAGAVALTLAVAGGASAHHCYKTDWQDRAHQNLSGGGTAWMPLSDLVTWFASAGGEDCAALAGDVTQAWMDEVGATSEPLIHSRATVGGGAFYHKGKTPGSIQYLGDADFIFLEGTLRGHAACSDLPVMEG